MDDIRRPQGPTRRDYTVPVQHRPYAPPTRPTPYSPQPHQRPAPAHQPPPTPHQPHQTTPHHQPVHHTPQASGLERPAHPIAHQPRAATKRRNLKPILIISLPLVAAAIFAAGYSLKSSSDANTIPASIAKQANFNLYFPSPMPAGYTYMKDTATFQIGEVFYKFSNGSKRVTVKEEPLPTPKPDLNLLAGYAQFDTSIGKAALGTAFGEPTAVVVTPTTVITLNSTGGVNKEDLKMAIDNLKNIGQKPNG